jgi:zinc protease
MSALAANLERSLALLADVVESPAFPAEEFARQKNLQLAAIERERAEPSAMAQRVLPRLVYGEGHAYANPLTGSGTRASVAAIARAAAERWFRTWFRPGNARLVVVGDATLARIRPILERLFGAWPAGEVPAKAVGPAAPAPAARLYLVDRPGSAQSVILAGLAAPPRANPEEVAQAAANRILGGSFVSRINLNLREDKHWTYGARSALLDAKGPRLFYVSAPVQADKTKESVEEIRRELAGLRGDRPPAPAELAAARDAMALALPGRWETGSAVAGSIVEVLTFGLGERYYDAYPAKVRALEPAEVARAARFIDPDRVVWVVVGDRTKVEKPLAELGLGAPVVVDADGQPAR